LALARVRVSVLGRPHCRREASYFLALRSATSAWTFSRMFRGAGA
jgi:hypothetical protein